MGVFQPQGTIPDQPRPLPSDILVVEDNFIIALDLKEILCGLGAASVRTASSVRQALQEIEANPPKLGLIDVNLGGEKSFEVAERLRELGIPFVFTTGYGDKLAFPTNLADTQILSKPYSVESLRAAIAGK